MLSASLPWVIDQELENPDGFYPSQNVGDWQRVYRVPGTAPETLAAQLLLAMLKCNNDLQSWRKEQAEAGVAALPEAQHPYYQDAVYAHATALLIPLLPSLITDERAREEMAMLRQQPQDYRCRAEQMLNRLRGKAPGAHKIGLL